MSNFHGNSWPHPSTIISSTHPFFTVTVPNSFLQPPFTINVQQTSPNGTTSVFTTPSSSSSPVSPTTNTNVIPRPTDSPILTALPPYPPNWHERYQNTITSHRNYQLFPVTPNTFEYAAIASLLDPACISSVEQIVNPTLWSRFVNTRKEMLKVKCNDLELLSKLELSETELFSSYQHSINFETNPKVLHVPYNDNMALLLHCVRDPNNIEKILREGLDERMGSAHGLLGKGIYFADNPEKSMTYDGCGGIIFVFAVLLGDCLAVDGPMNHFVREPEKWPEQKRNFNDLFFDSIVGQPGVGLDNEYVIYNRHQCCPLYLVKYSPGNYTARANSDSDVYVTSRKYLPPMGWTSSKNYYVTPAKVQKTWPFYAKTIFGKMGASVETVEENDDQVETRKKVAAKKPSGLSLKLKRLNEMGFCDRDENIEILRKFNFQLDKCVNYLVNQK
ncbi:hypothetical protein HA402_006549 [Bradysia odoriphaga]|nr:hypothetical protein HA402_006549 [Bradysia odoriphaga]